MATYKFVPGLEDLIQPDDYDSDPRGARIRIRISPTECGIEILGDAMTPSELEFLLESAGATEIEQMLCG